MKIDLKKDYKCVKIIDEINKIIQEYMTLFDSECNTIKDEQRQEILEAILDYYIIKKTNLVKVLNFLKVSKNFGYIDIISEMCKSRKDPTINNFLDILNSKINKIKEKEPDEFNFYIPVRVKLELKDDEKRSLKRAVKNAFGIEIVDSLPSDILEVYKDKNYLKLFSKRLILKITESGRDYTFPFENSIKPRIKAFIGAIGLSSLIFSFIQQIDFTKVDKASWDYSLKRNPIENALIITNKNNEIVYPSEESIQQYELWLDDDSVSIIGKDIWRIHKRPYGNFKTLMTILEKISQLPDKIRELLFYCLDIYFEAIVDRQLEFSFLKFWIIIEVILKQGGRRTDKSIIDLLTKLTKQIIDDKQLAKMIPILYKKRNVLVHEFKKNYITQMDRNLAKIIAERLIWIVLDPPVKVHDLNELRVLIDNLVYSKEELQKRIEILSKILNAKNCLVE